jgi:excinuclease ABC subunit B
VTDDPTAKIVSLPSPGERASSRRSGQRQGASKVHKPGLDEMGIALYHEMKPVRSGRKNPRKPTLDEMGPGVESIPGKRQEAGSGGGATGTSRSGPRSTLGRPGMHGGWKPSRPR